MPIFKPHPMVTVKGGTSIASTMVAHAVLPRMVNHNIGSLDKEIIACIGGDTVEKR